jgi:hypothetical protein
VRSIFQGIAAISVMLLCGCAAVGRVDYPLEDIVLAPQSPFRTASLAVLEFKDIRETPSDLETPAHSPGIVKKEGVTWYYNSNENYKNDVVAPWVTQMIGNHLDESRLFSSVAVASKPVPTSDYTLEGKIKKFEAYKESKAATMVGQQFGFIGVLASAGVKSHYTAACFLADVTLRDTGNGMILWQGNVEGVLEGQDYADAYGWSVYQKANLALKEAVKELVMQLQDVQIAKPNNTIVEPSPTGGAP